MLYSGKLLLEKVTLHLCLYSLFLSVASPHGTLRLRRPGQRGHPCGHSGTHAGTRAPMRALGHGPQSRVADTARRLTATHATNGIPLRHARASALQPAVRPLLSLSATAVVSALVSGLCRASHLGRSHSASLQQALLDHPTAPSRFTGTCVVPRV